MNLTGYVGQMKKIVLFLTFFSFLAFLGCHKNVNPKNAQDQRFVNLSFLSSLRSLDPRVSNEFPSCHVMNMAYEGLMHLDSNGKLKCGIAKAVDISEDQ